MIVVVLGSLLASYLVPNPKSPSNPGGTLCCTTALTVRGYTEHGGWVPPGSNCPLPLWLAIEFKSNVPVEAYVTDSSDVNYNYTNQTLTVASWYYASGDVLGWGANLSVPISDPVVVIFNPSYISVANVQTNNWPYSCS